MYDDEEGSSEEMSLSSGSEEVSVDYVVGENEISDNEEDSYDSDLYIDEVDREDLSRLPESRREEVLFERSERRKQIRERNALKNKLRAQLQKGRRGVSDVGGYAARSARDGERLGGRRQDALGELRVQRERSKVDSNRRCPPAPVPGELNDGVSSLSSSGDQPVRGDAKRDAADFMVRDETTYQDICRITVHRDMLIKWVGEPYWDRTIRGVFVRACVGQSATGGVYRLAEVVDYRDQENTKYTMGGKEYSTKLSLTIGDVTRDFTLEYISNYLPSESEYQDWKRLVLGQKLLLPTREDIKHIYANIDAAVNYVHTWEDVDRKVAENDAKLKREGRNLAVYSPILRKNTLVMLKYAQSRQDHASIARLESELRELDKLKAAEQMRSVIATANAQVIQSINQKNRGKNTAIERSYVPESSVLETELNPFARRPTYSSVFVAKQTKPLIEAKESAITKSEAARDASSPPPPHQLEDIVDWNTSVDAYLKFDLDGHQVVSPTSRDDNDNVTPPLKLPPYEAIVDQAPHDEARIPAPNVVPGRVLPLTEYLRQKRRH